MTGHPSRRRVLGAIGAGVAGGLTGCLGGSGSTCPDTGIAVETPDGETRCVSPVESDTSITDYYGYDRGPSDSSSTPDGLEENDATVTFLYRDTETDTLCLVFLNGDATESSDGGGKAVMTFEGVSGYEWQVQDGSPGTGSGDVDPYETEDGEFGESESVIWGWNDGRTDGGAFGTLGEEFDINFVHRAEGTVRETTKQRNGLDRWLFVDGGDPDNPIELATFGDGGTGDVSVRVFSTE